MILVLILGQDIMSITFISNISAYNGSLTAMLTYPARSAAIDSFADFLDLPEEATLYAPASTSMIEVIKHSSDPIMQVSNGLNQSDVFHFLRFMCRIL